MKLVFKCIVPLDIPSQNVRDRQHWSVDHAQSTKWESCLVKLMWIVRTPKASGPRKVAITSYRKRLITDKANLSGGAKGAIDAMVRAGLLVNDSDKWATFEYKQELASKTATGKPGTLVEVWDLEGVEA